MKPLCRFLVMIPLTLVGCGNAPAVPETAPVDAALGTPATTPDAAMNAAATKKEIALTPENTTIQFVGVHTDPAKPDPRTGQFTAFEGQAVVEGHALQSLRVEIETKSLTTEIDKLTEHLLSGDFFNIGEHPQATFVSTKIEPNGTGQVNVTGDLTLLGQTQSITFPAAVSTVDGLSLKAEFNIDRTQFGMNFGVDKIEKEVKLTINVDG